MNLKPYPFCGGDAEFERFGTGRRSTIVVCQECGCRMESPETFNHGSYWNARASDELICELVDMLESITGYVDEIFVSPEFEELSNISKGILTKASNHLNPHAENTPHQPDALAAE